MSKGNGRDLQRTDCSAEARVLFEKVILTMACASEEDAHKLCHLINTALGIGQVMYFAPPPPPEEAATDPLSSL